MNPRKLFLGIVLPAFLFLIAWSVATGPALAQTIVSTTTTTGGNWTATGTWTCSPSLSPCVPNNTAGTLFDTSINAAGNAVTLDDTSTPTKITVDTLALQGGTLNVMNSASLTVSRNATNAGQLNLANVGKLSVAGTLTNSGTVQIGSNLSPFPGGILTVGGLDNSGFIALYSGAMLVLNRANGTYANGGGGHRSGAAWRYHRRRDWQRNTDK